MKITSISMKIRRFLCWMMTQPGAPIKHPDAIMSGRLYFEAEGQLIYVMDYTSRNERKKIINDVLSDYGNTKIEITIVPDEQSKTGPNTILDGRGVSDIIFHSANINGNFNITG